MSEWQILQTFGGTCCILLFGWSDGNWCW